MHQFNKHAAEKSKRIARSLLFGLLYLRNRFELWPNFCTNCSSFLSLSFLKHVNMRFSLAYCIPVKSWFWIFCCVIALLLNLEWITAMLPKEHCSQINVNRQRKNSDRWQQFRFKKQWIWNFETLMFIFFVQEYDILKL